MNMKQYKKGHFVSIGLALGIPLGIPIGIVIGNIALGPAIGLSIGLLIGFIMEKKLNNNPVELTEKENKKLNKWSFISMIVGLMVFVFLILIYFYNK